MKRLIVNSVVQLNWLLPVLVIVTLAGQSPARSSLSGGIPCNSQENMKLVDCTGCTDTVSKCNEAQGDKTKLCNVDAGGKCHSSCTVEKWDDEFSTTPCEAGYN